MASKEKEYWIRAMQEELNSMSLSGVWNLVDKHKPKTDGRKPNVIDSKWVYKRKIEADGSIKYKARLVIKGFKDKNTYD